MASEYIGTIALYEPCCAIEIRNTVGTELGKGVLNSRMKIVNNYNAFLSRRDYVKERSTWKQSTEAKRQQRLFYFVSSFACIFHKVKFNDRFQF